MPLYGPDGHVVKYVTELPSDLAVTATGVAGAAFTLTLPAPAPAKWLSSLRASAPWLLRRLTSPRYAGASGPPSQRAPTQDIPSLP